MPSTKKSKKRYKGSPKEKVVEKAIRTDLGWIISSKYATTLGVGGELRIVCTDCKEPFTPNGIRLRNKAKLISAEKDCGNFVCSECLNK